MDRVLITGGLGFIGGHLAMRLKKDGCYVAVLDNMISGADFNASRLKKAGIEIMYGDTTVWKTWTDIIEEHSLQFDSVFNLACPASPVAYTKHPVETLRAGSLGVFNAIRYCEAVDANMLHTSTSEIYGDPLMSPQKETYWGNVNPIGPRSMYDESKRFAEAVIADANRRDPVRIKTVRLFNSYGPYTKHDDGRAVPNFIYQCIKNIPITIYGNGGQTRSLCYIDDTIDGILAVYERGDYKPYNIGNPEEISINDLALVIKELVGSSNELVFKDLPEDDPRVRVPDIHRIKKIGWEPQVTLRTGLKRTIKWFRERYNEPA